MIDSRLGVLERLRQGVGTMLYPVQRALLVPRELLELGSGYLSGVNRLRAENAELRRIEVANARALLQAEQIAAENAALARAARRTRAARDPVGDRRGALRHP